MDRRFWPATERVAHVSLQGRIDGVAFTEGRACMVGSPLVDLQRAPDGPRERQLPRGTGFTVVEEVGGWAFGFAEPDGYCGWMRAGNLIAPHATSHWVASVGTHLYAEPRVQAFCGVMPMGARLRVTGQVAGFAEVDGGFVPASHLRPIGDWLADPVAVAEGFLGTPYLWGGNSRAGLDCSGLVQLAFHACGLPCPADSDLQQALGFALPDDAALQRGDLVFWKGHVALVADATRILHANGHTMSVAYEPIKDAIARIIAQNGGPVIARRRVAAS
ncbi:MAG: C40 family peptidase [Rhodobacteraceae bacterium]|nr:C40 family peptidase [Paracoccaceae bacterium]